MGQVQDIQTRFIMIRANIKIGAGAKSDFFDRFGFIYLSSDRRFAPPEKKRATSSYAEEAGSHEDPRTVDDEFDYKMRFLIEAPNRNLINVNSKIKAFNDAIRERGVGSDVKRCPAVTVWDTYKRVSVTGIAEVIDEADENDYYRREDGRQDDYVVVTLTIHVSDPTLCDFDLNNESQEP